MEKVDGTIVCQLQELRKSLPGLYNSPNCSDITLEVNETTFYAHKSILYTSSSFFRAMFDSKMKESTANTIKLSDPIGPFTQFLQYVYGLPISLKEITDILALWELANFYGVNELKTSCLSLMKIDQLSPWQYLDVALAVNDPSMIEESIKRLVHSMHTYIYFDDTLFDVNYDTLVTLISHKSYTVPDEQNTLSLIIRWTKSKLDQVKSVDKSDIQTQLNNLLELVRWDLITERFLLNTMQEIKEMNLEVKTQKNKEPLSSFLAPTPPTRKYRRGSYFPLYIPPPSPPPPDNIPFEMNMCHPRGPEGSSQSNALLVEKIQEHGNLQSGNYWFETDVNQFEIQHKTNTFYTYYESDFQGYSWVLVRRHAPSTVWKDNPNDLLAGIVSYCHGPEYKIGPNSPFSFSHQYNHLTFDKFLFTTGDQRKWLICDRSEIKFRHGCSGELEYAKIEKSHVFNGVYTTTWRTTSFTAGGPWICASTYNYKGVAGHSDNEEHSMLYGEKSKSNNTPINTNTPLWTYYLQHHDGCNVWVHLKYN